MAVAKGIKTELALAQEATYGSSTGVGTKQYFDAVSESVVVENPNIVSARLRGGRLPTASALVKGGRKRVTGNVEVEVQAQSIGWFLKHLMGSVSTTGASPYTHTFTLGDIPTGLHLYIKRDIQTFTYKGTKLNTAEFSVSDQMLRCTFGVLGQDATLGDAFGTASYPASNEIFAFHEVTIINLDGSSVDAREASISFDNQLIEMPKLGTRLNRQPVDGRAVITGTIRKEYEDDSAYTKFVNGTQASFQMKFVGSGGSELDFNFAAIFYTGGTPTVGTTEPIPQELPFEVRDDGTANGGITVTLKNTTSTYA